MPFAWQGLLYDMKSGCPVPWGLIQSLLLLTTIWMVWNTACSFCFLLIDHIEKEGGGGGKMDHIEIHV